ncbi:MAG: ComF family protein [Solobacterium sp.]|nr:ComF family protein [Solobacterium sp.]
MRCLMCGRPMYTTTINDLFSRQDVLCAQCRAEWKRLNRTLRFEGKKLHVLYEYNPAFASCLLQYKECMDEALKPVFLYPDRTALKLRYIGRTILLLPSEPRKLQERGFSHLAGMFEGLGLPVLEPFYKDEERSQKGHSAKEREAMIKHIRLKTGITLPKHVVLADDVITTGSTMKGALSVLPERTDVVLFSVAMALRQHQGIS